MTFPQVGINSLVRVCVDCFNDSYRYSDHAAKPSINGADQIADLVEGLDIGPEADPAVKPVVQGNPKCKCGMPLCICEAPNPSTDSLSLSMSNSRQAANDTSGKPKMDYDVNGEGLGEAIKNDDAAAVKKLFK